MHHVGLPRDPAQWLALVLAVAVVLAARRLLRASSRPRLFAAIAALAAAALSAAYVPVYLRGGPRIIDATSYFLEARALAHGLLSFPLHAPETSVLGRFLVRSEHADGAHAAVIFPPGYPAVLALGFLARAPLAVGPVLAAALAIVTFDLAGHVARSLALPRDAPSLPQLAVVFSVVCAALRYHTADTMSHGLAALCLASALSLAFHAVDALAAGRARRAAALVAGAGLAAGWLFATRPVSALALAPALVLALAPARSSALRLAPLLALGALPGVMVFLVHQHAATGVWGASSQRLYYAVADGPAGCFRYGFGAGVGCIGEHGDFVRARLAHGFGFVAAAGTTLRRLKMHLVDPANAEPLALLVPLGVWIARSSPRTKILGVAVAAQIAAYVPFYFDGNYPGGGGRFYADVLPVEHVLAAAAVVILAARRASPARWAAAAPALALVGFAFRAGFDHAALRDHDGGRPMFEPAELARAGVTRGLVLFGTDHGFDLAFDPAGDGEVQAARFHGDDLDRLAWEARGRPPTYRYKYVIPPGGGHASVAIEPLAFPPPTGARTIEGESLWPPLAQEGGFALAEWVPGACVSGGRWLAIRSGSDSSSTSVSLALPANGVAGASVAPRIAGGGAGEVEISADGAILRRWAVAAEAGALCRDLDPARVPAGARNVILTLRRPPAAPAAPPFALDAVGIRD